MKKYYYRFRKDIFFYLSFLCMALAVNGTSVKAQNFNRISAGERDILEEDAIYAVNFEERLQERSPQINRQRRALLRDNTQTPAVDERYKLIGPIQGTEQSKTASIREFEEALGITIEASHFKIGNLKSTSMTKTYVASIDPKSRIAAEGVMVGDFISLLGIGVVDQRRDSSFVRDLDSFSFANEVPYFHLTFKRGYDISGKEPAIDVKYLSVKNASFNYTQLNKNPKILRIINAPFQKPNLTSLQRGYPSLIRGNSSCDLQILKFYVVTVTDEKTIDLSTAQTIGRAGVDFCLPARKFKIYHYSAYGDLVNEYVYRHRYHILIDFTDINHPYNVSGYGKNDTLLTLLASESIAFLRGDPNDLTGYHYYYHFAKQYALQCSVAPENLTAITLTNYETTTQGGVSSSSVTDQNTFYVEKRTADNVIKYGKQYVFGLTAIQSRNQITDVIQRFGCNSEVTQNIRNSLYEFGKK